MRIIGLVGSSGTGKSHKAIPIASSYELDLIIDDGILIKGNKIIAGLSAKKESTKLKAVKRAIYMDSIHRENMIKTINDTKPNGILVLGTSTAMIKKIVKALTLPEPEKIVFIEEVASPKQIETALSIRKNQGKHVIPVPTLEIKKDFSGYLLDSLRTIRGKKDINSSNTIKYSEKSVVRPTFSYMGKYTISNSAISSIITYEGEKFDDVAKVGRIDLQNRSEGTNVYIEISIYYGKPIIDILKNVQAKIKEKLEHTTALNIVSLDIKAAKLVLRKDNAIKKPFSKFKDKSG